MPKKTKAKPSVARKEDKSNDACSGTTNGEENIYSHTGQSSDIKEKAFIENTVGPDSISKKKNLNSNLSVRRSNRLKSSVSPNVNQKVNNIIDQVNIIENEKEKAPQVQEVATLPVVSKKNLEEEDLQAQQITTLPVVSEEAPQLNHMSEDERILEDKVVRRPNEEPTDDLSYKSLYIDSQKNIEALMEKHYELIKELEFAKGKIEAYEKMNSAKVTSREVILVSGLGKGTETTVKLSPQKAQGENADDHNVTPKPKNNYKKKRARS